MVNNKDVEKAFKHPDLSQICTVDKLSQQLEKSNDDLCGIKVESHREFKFSQSIDSDKSLESIQSSTSNIDSINSEKFYKEEKWYSVTLQVLVPFLIAGMGTIGAGIVLGEVEQYDVFAEVDALFILVPAVLGLKGNLDMCLASRLSTQANLGTMKFDVETVRMILGNVGLVQIQAIVAAVIVSLYATFISTVIVGSEFDLDKAALLMSCSTLTATISCFCLDFLLTAVIFSSHKMGLNPDNMATSLAASIGDVVSLTALSKFAVLLYKYLDDAPWIFYVIIAVYVLIILPVLIFITIQSAYTKQILTHGWVPVISALFISGIGGLVLDTAVNDFRGYVVFQPIVNGIGGNLVSVYASRTSTLLHKTSLLGIIPPHTKQWVSPWTALFDGVLSAKTSRILIAITVPGQLVFVLAADIIYNSGELAVTPEFVLTYLFISLVQVILLLYLGHLLIHTLWRRKIDPDTSSIPYLTALGDLFGSTFLLLGFMFLRSVGREYVPL